MSQCVCIVSSFSLRNVSHHNVVGSRYNDQTRSMRISQKVTKNGFALETDSPTQVGGPSVTTFRAPSSVAITPQYMAETVTTTTNVTNSVPVNASFSLELYASPSRPGFCNHIGYVSAVLLLRLFCVTCCTRMHMYSSIAVRSRFLTLRFSLFARCSRSVVVKDPDGSMPKFLRQFTLPLPKWVLHQTSSAFLNQDALFLHAQERQLASTGQYASFDDGSDRSGRGKYKDVTVPIEVDRGVLAFRDWLQKKAGGVVPYRNRWNMPPVDNEVVFDVWNGHTKYCKMCLKAVSNLKKLRFAAFTVATCLAVLRPFRNPFAMLASVGVTAGAALLLNKLIGMFYRYEFSHAHND